MLINASGVNILNWEANYSWYFRWVNFKASHVALMKQTGLACPLCLVLITLAKYTWSSPHTSVRQSCLSVGQVWIVLAGKKAQDEASSAN